MSQHLGKYDVVRLSGLIGPYTRSPNGHHVCRFCTLSNLDQTLASNASSVWKHTLDPLWGVARRQFT